MAVLPASLLPLVAALATDLPLRQVDVQTRMLRSQSVQPAKDQRPTPGLQLAPRGDAIRARLAADGSLRIDCGSDPFLPDLRFDRPHPLPQDEP